MRKALILCMALAIVMALGSVVGAEYRAGAAVQSRMAGGITVGAVVKDCADCPPMVAVPAVGERDITPGKPPLYVARHELTWREYLVAVRETACSVPALDRGKPYDIRDPRLDDDHPVTGVAPNDIGCYLNWISAKAGKTYRLPSPREWEHAARAGTTTRFPWGDEIGFNNTIINGYFDVKAAQAKRGRSVDTDQRSSVKHGTHYPVETLPPNAWGIYDVIGNVTEVTSETKPARPGHCLENFGPILCKEYSTRGEHLFLDTELDSVSRATYTWGGIQQMNMGFRLVRD